MRVGIERRGFGAVVGLVFGVMLAVASMALGVPGWLAALVGLTSAATVLELVARRLPAEMDGAFKRFPLACTLWAILGLGALLLLARLSLFMLDASRTGDSAMPFDPFYVSHSCFSAYYESAVLADKVPNVYDHAAFPEKIGAFYTDSYHYPPPFLIAARAALQLSQSFFTLRTLWFALDVLLLVAASLGLARWIGGREGLRAGLLAPLLWVGLPTLLALQTGNFQIGAYSLAVLSMIAFERGRHAIGGAVLGFVTVSKLFPGLLVLYLALQRRWREVVWTCGMAVAWTLVGLALLGRAPFDAFLHYHLPKLADGSAFPFLFDDPTAVSICHSVFCMVLKADVLGVPHMTRGVAIGAGWVYTLALVVLVVLLARRARSAGRPAEGAPRLEEGAVWVLLLFLAALRSPFAPQQDAQVAPIWLWTLVAAGFATRPRAVAMSALVLVCLNFLVPLDAVRVDPWPVWSLPTMGVRTLLALNLVPQLAALAVVCWALRRRLARSSYVSW